VRHRRALDGRVDAIEVAHGDGLRLLLQLRLWRHTDWDWIGAVAEVLEQRADHVAAARHRHGA
jgi:hypothetical protein